MSENHREPEVSGEEVPVVECLDGLARITSEELAITHFVKSGTLQNACSTSQRVVASGGQGDGGLQGMPLTGDGGLARVPNLRVCEHPLDFGVAHAGREG